MSSNVLFFGWNRSVPGRERMSAEHFQSFGEYLTAQQRRRLIEKADPDTADFIRALLHSAARPNEMQAARVSDFDARERTLRLVSLKGRGEERVVRRWLSAVAETLGGR